MSYAHDQRKKYPKSWQNLLVERGVPSFYSNVKRTIDVAMLLLRERIGSPERQKPSASDHLLPSYSRHRVLEPFRSRTKSLYKITQNKIGICMSCVFTFRKCFIFRKSFIKVKLIPWTIFSLLAFPRAVCPRYRTLFYFCHLLVIPRNRFLTLGPMKSFKFNGLHST